MFRTVVRGFGRPVQGLEHVGVVEQAYNAFDDWSTEELRTLVEAFRALRDAEAGVIDGEARAIE